MRLFHVKHTSKTCYFTIGERWCTRLQNLTWSAYSFYSDIWLIQCGQTHRVLTGKASYRKTFLYTDTRFRICLAHDDFRAHFVQHLFWTQNWWRDVWIALRLKNTAKSIREVQKLQTKSMTQRPTSNSSMNHCGRLCFTRKLAVILKLRLLERENDVENEHVTNVTWSEVESSKAWNIYTKISLHNRY